MNKNDLLRVLSKTVLLLGSANERVRKFLRAFYFFVVKEGEFDSSLLSLKEPYSSMEALEIYFKIRKTYVMSHTSIEDSLTNLYVLIEQMDVSKFDKGEYAKVKALDPGSSILNGFEYIVTYENFMEKFGFMSDVPYEYTEYIFEEMTPSDFKEIADLLPENTFFKFGGKTLVQSLAKEKADKDKENLEYLKDIE